MANGESVADPLRTVCQAHWTAPATLAHHPARPGRDEQRSLVKLAQVVRDTACSLLEALAGSRSLCSVLQSIQRRMRSGCQMNKRKKHPNSAQLLACGSTNWTLSP